MNSDTDKQHQNGNTNFSKNQKNQRTRKSPFSLQRRAPYRSHIRQHRSSSSSNSSSSNGNIILRGWSARAGSGGCAVSHA